MAVLNENTIEAVLRSYVDVGALAGAATLVWRGGHVTHTANVGRRDLVAELPVERDTIFRIASMTKPVTTVAALMLLDEDRFTLDDPVARYAPELARLRVLRDPNGPLDETYPTERPITLGARTCRDPPHSEASRLADGGAPSPSGAGAAVAARAF